MEMGRLLGIILCRHARVVCGEGEVRKRIRVNQHMGDREYRERMGEVKEVQFVMCV